MIQLSLSSVTNLSLLWALIKSLLWLLLVSKSLHFIKCPGHDSAQFELCY